MPEIEMKNGTKVQIDEKYEDVLRCFKWSGAGGKSTTQRYAATEIAGRRVYMHRLIMQMELGHRLSRDDEVDHINSDAMDNRVCNLRLCVHHQNTMHQGTRKDSTTGFIGVSNESRLKEPYRAKLFVNGKNIHLGGYTNPEEAAIQRDIAAVKHFGVFAKLNFEDRRADYQKKLDGGYDPEAFFKSRQHKKNSKYHGVYWERTSVHAKYHRDFLGTFHTEESAARAYDLKAIERKGDSAKLNFEDKREEYKEMVAAAYDLHDLNKQPRQSSKYRGVIFDKRSSKWKVIAQKDKKAYWVGLFADEVEAAHAYDAKAKELNGPKAKLNFPDE